MDAIAPALIGLGIWFAYEAWTNPDPHPVQKITSKLTGSSSSSGVAGGGTPIQIAPGSTSSGAPYTGGNSRTVGAT